MNAASIQALWPRTFGSRPSRAATCSRRSSTIGSAGETSNGSRTSVVAAAELAPGRAPAATSRSSSASSCAASSPGSVRRSIDSTQRSG